MSTTTPQTPPAADRHAPSRTHRAPVEGDPGRSDFPTSSPGLPTTARQINRLRSLLAWCEDYAHALPDGWSADVYPTGSTSLNWIHLDHGDQIAERVRETFGQPDYVLGDVHWWEARDDRPRLTVHYVTATEAGTS